MLKLEYLQTLDKKEFLIGSLKVYVYNSSVLPSYVELFRADQKTSSIPIDVLYLIHQRQGDYTYTQAIAEKIITQYSKDAQVPMIAVTFDIANHGQRQVSETANSDWRDGNESHALDMISCIDLTVHDIKLVMNLLPSFLNLEAYVGPHLKEDNVSIQYRNFLSGYSIGGHIVIRFASRNPELVTAINPNVGCSDLTGLLYNRLRKSKDYDKKYFYCTYDELDLSETEKERYPEAIHRYISREDIHIFELFPTNKVLMFATFYDDDPLVPSRISKLWVDMYLNNNSKSEVYYEQGKVHDITENMVDRYIDWLKAEAENF